MNTHKNARMTVHGRRALLVKRIVEERWQVAEAAETVAAIERLRRQRLR